MADETLGRMDAFERILIKWVNCLKIAEPIRELEDLKNEIIFRNLLIIIFRRDLPCLETDTLTTLFRLLEWHYPKFMIDNKSNIHFNDLPHETLLCIVSLILHYICVYDKIPVFTSSLCTELDTPSQLAIKNFLEKIADCAELDNATLFQAMYSSVENEKAQSAQEESPLQFLLKTPVSKVNRFIKREQEIANLTIEVELLQVEKEQLEADLKLERVQNKSLDSSLYSEDLAHSEVDVPFIEQGCKNSILKSADVKNANEELSELYQILTTERNELRNKLIIRELFLKNLSQNLSQAMMVNDEIFKKCNDPNMMVEAVEDSKEEEKSPVDFSETELEVQNLSLGVINMTNNFKAKFYENDDVINNLQLDMCKLRKEYQQITDQNIDLEKKLHISKNDLELATKDTQIAVANYLKCLSLANLLFTNYRDLVVCVFLLKSVADMLNFIGYKIMEKVVHLRCDREMLLQQCANNYRNIADLEVQNNNILRDLSTAQQHRNEMLLRCKEVEDGLLNVKMEYEKFKTLVTERDSNNEQQKMTLTRTLTSALNKLRTCILENKALTEKVEYSENELGQLRQEVRTLQMSLNEAKLHNQTIKENRSVVMEAQAETLLSDHVQEPENEMTNRQMVLDEKMIELNEAHLKIGNLTRENLEISHSLESTLKQLEASSLEKCSLIKTVECFKKEMTRLFKENKMLRCSLEVARTEQEEQSAIVNSQAAALQDENCAAQLHIYQQQVDDLKKQLSEAKYKIRMVEFERHLADQRNSQTSMNSRESVLSSPEQSSLRDPETVRKPLSSELPRKAKNVSTVTTSDTTRRPSKLPRPMFAEMKENVDITWQSSVGAHATIGNLEMEDETDFNDHYLLDVNGASCVVNEPAGNINPDNSQCESSSSEEPHQKKAIGITYDRKPDPPIPSENARISQQSDEIQILPVEHKRTVRRSIRNQNRMMLTGSSSNSQVKDNTKNHTDTPKINKRSSLFRKQK